ncbi:MAG TPA: peptidoglycan DD-metalloendopeptidase family protein [Xanthobacteraceae bacterium]|nr:peptidoglycan DD-metalloendopeptidase family protein [Xanthobacteraceae bacterium]
MRIPACIQPSPRFVRLGAIGLFGFLLAACGNDVTRFNDDPNGNPYRRGEVTNSAQPAPYSQPTAQIESRPLSAPANVNGTPVYGPSVYGANGSYNNPPPPGYPPNNQSYQPNYQPTYSNAPNAVPATPAPVSRAPTPAYQEPTGSVGGRDENWGWDGGTAITLKPGETVEILSRRYHVPVVAIMRANNLADASRIQPGQRIVIPNRRSQEKVAASGAANRDTVIHTVMQHETLASIAKRYDIKGADIAYANNINEHVPLRVGQKLTIPNVAIANSNAPKNAANPAPASPRADAPQRRVETAPPVDNAATVKPAEDEPDPKPAGVGGLQFRWPLKGRVISGFGDKPNGQRNDGINILVPENTAVKAAEDGVVAYAGNELKGYGNLVLIKHADGWVTAYAHNSEVLVHRGETVKRGQVISKAGQSGGVASPQLHFEIRKGSTPVDPAQHLSSL